MTAHLAAAEDHVASQRERARVNRARRRIGVAAIVDAHVAQVTAEARLHEGSNLAVQRPAAPQRAAETARRHRAGLGLVRRQVRRGSAAGERMTLSASRSAWCSRGSSTAPISSPACHGVGRRAGDQARCAAPIVPGVVVLPAAVAVAVAVLGVRAFERCVGFGAAAGFFAADFLMGGAKAGIA